MTLENLIIKQKLCLTLDSNSGTNVIPLFIYTPYAKVGYKIVDEYLEISDLKAVAWIYSLAPVTFPVFQLTDSESMQLLSAINLEWKSPRIQLDILCKIDNLAWQKIQAFSLLNPDPYPYREYSLGSHILGNNGMIGFQITDVDFGLLKNQDKVTIFADLIRQIVIDQPPIIINVMGGVTPEPEPEPEPEPTPTPEEEEMPIQVKSADYQLVNRDRIFTKIDVTNVNFTLNLPVNPLEGYEVEIICSRNYQSKKVNVFAAGNIKVYGGVRASGIVFVNNENRGGKLLYTEDEGWIAYPNSGAKFGFNDPNADF